ncbi:sodium/potassium-transporting ATPase subunit beta-1 [Drosophila mojavensis]|uniref:Uncharacterized protein n=1 Tax=Drosophila mojavensis TaxID=7230 RepID=A0A0Q9XE17_DROMO|nr:sodium/potassium-transporting ATPase subunit beta-1 [Drosophila mojavensis]KRG02914.1 uncharacterized protein Dmoj_GI26565 [Drosophila mojavensis]
MDNEEKDIDKDKDKDKDQNQDKGKEEYEDETVEELNVKIGPTIRESDDETSQRLPHKTISDTLTMPIAHPRPQNIGIRISSVKSSRYSDASRPTFLYNRITESSSNSDTNINLSIIPSMFTGSTVSRTIDGDSEHSLQHRGIVRLPPEHKSYEIDGSPRKLYPNCEYHFPHTKHLSRKLFYDGKRNLCFSRRPKSWIYSLIYVLVFMFFVIYVDRVIFRRFVLNYNMIAPELKIRQPYLSFAPIGAKQTYRLIEYDLSNYTSVIRKRQQLQEFLDRHGRSQGAIRRFGPCQKEYHFGYNSLSPCVFIKMNRLLRFTAQPYKTPEDISPAAIVSKDYEKLMYFVWNATETQKRINYIWLTCDSEPITQLKFHPRPAFDARYVCVKRFKGIKTTGRDLEYISKLSMNRLIAIKLNNLKLNVKHQFTCKIWANNIKNNQPGLGQVTFFVLPRTRGNVKNIHYHEGL